MPIEFSEVRYIKLGKAGCWNDISINNSEIHFGFGGVPHELALRKDTAAIKQVQLNVRKRAAAAADDAREVADFYTLGRECLWITFARGHMWWTFSDPEVVWLGDDGLGHDSPAHGQRKRRCDGWSNVDQNGRPLTIDGLSTSLTKVAAYRRTLCRVPTSESYLRQRINGIVDPLVEEAKIAGAAMLDILERTIKRLHQNDFETLIDVVFARSGWHRTTALGGIQEFIDLAIEQPATGERAAVQIKSQATQSVLDDYIARYDAAGTFSRLFFVCHTATAGFNPPNRSDIHVWEGKALATVVLRLGLADWVQEKIS
ncbi:hypothetical protein BH10PSE11_BH10PSE11_17840 [soil metagenome]